MKLSLGCANTPVASGGGKGEVHCFCPLSILKWVGAPLRNEVGHVFCHRCLRNQNVCVLFLAAMIGSVILIFIFEFIRNLLNE